MKLKSRPSKPIRKKETVSFGADGYSLSAIFKEMQQYLEDRGWSDDEIKEICSLDNIRISLEWDYDCERSEAQLEAPEPELRFNQRMQYYNRRIKDYNEWYRENEDAIIAEKEKRALEGKATEAQKLKAKMKQIELQLEKLET